MGPAPHVRIRAGHPHTHRFAHTQTYSPSDALTHGLTRTQTHSLALNHNRTPSQSDSIIPRLTHTQTASYVVHPAQIYSCAASLILRLTRTQRHTHALRYILTLKLTPRRSQDTSKWPPAFQGAQIWAQETPKRLRSAQKNLQEAPNTAPRYPQGSPKPGPYRTSKEAPETSPRGLQEDLQEAILFLLLRCGPKRASERKAAPSKRKTLFWLVFC